MDLAAFCCLRSLGVFELVLAWWIFGLKGWRLFAYNVVEYDWMDACLLGRHHFEPFHNELL